MNGWAMLIIFTLFSILEHFHYKKVTGKSFNWWLKNHNNVKKLHVLDDI